SMAAPAYPADCRSPINSNSAPTFWLSSRAEPGNQHRRIFDAVARTASSLKRDRRFADSPLEGDGFELVWGFSCQVVVFGFLPVLCSELESRSSSRRLRSGSRSARKGSRDRNGSKAWRLAAQRGLCFAAP